MKLLLTGFVLVIGSVSVQCQIKQIFPSSVSPLRFSAAGEEAFNKGVPNDSVFDNLGVLYIPKIDTASDGRIDSSYTEIAIKEFETYWDVLPPGCSWYCGGQVSKIVASSSLTPQGGFSYDAKHAHDFSYKTAWVEGANGHGIGEFLEYEFPAESARVHEIKIANGYVKSEKSWRENGRVKKLKLYHNGKAYAVLNLKNDRSEQVFNVGPFGFEFQTYGDKLATMEPWTLRFEILEVYPGTKYSDTVISEIHFMGYDPH